MWGLLSTGKKIILMVGAAVCILPVLVSHYPKKTDEKPVQGFLIVEDKTETPTLTASNLSVSVLTGLCTENDQIKALKQRQPFEGGSKRFEPMKIVGKAVSETFFICQVEGQQITSDRNGHDYATVFTQYNLIGAINSKLSAQVSAEIIDLKTLQDFLKAHLDHQDDLKALNTRQTEMKKKAAKK